MNTITADTLSTNDRVEEAIQVMNFAGTGRMLAQRSTLPESETPLLSVEPYDGPGNDDVVIRSYPYANGILDNQAAIDRLVSEVTGSRVVSIPMPSKDIAPAHNIDPVEDWYKVARSGLTDEEKWERRQTM